LYFKKPTAAAATIRDKLAVTQSTDPAVRYVSMTISTAMVIAAIKDVPLAKPSKPSTKFMALVTTTSQTMVSGAAKMPSGNTSPGTKGLPTNVIFIPKMMTTTAANTCPASFVLAESR